MAQEVLYHTNSRANAWGLFTKFKQALNSGNPIDGEFTMNLSLPDLNNLSHDELITCKTNTELFSIRAYLLLSKCYDLVDFVRTNDTSIITSMDGNRIQFKNKLFDSPSKEANFSEMIRLIQTQLIMCEKIYLERDDLPGTITEDMKVPFLQQSEIVTPSRSETLL